jgi:hypothetical protein
MTPKANPPSWGARRAAQGTSLVQDSSNKSTSQQADEAAIPEWTPFPVELLPSPLREFVTEGAAALGADPAMIGMPVLSVCAGAIGLTHAVELKTSWMEYAILWPAVVAESGTLKSPAQDLAVRPLLDLQSEQIAEYEHKRVAWEREYERYEAERADWRKLKPGTRGNPPEAPAEPVCERCVVSDSTVEALAPILAENPRGVLLARDELGGWLLSFNSYKQKGGDLQSWLELHRGGSLLVDRKSGRQVIHVSRASVSVTGTIQPGVLQRLLTPEFFSSGLAARLLFVMPPCRDKRWSERTISSGTRDMYAALLRRLLYLQFAADSDTEPRPVVVPLSDEAHALWVRWYDAFAKIQAESSGYLASSLSKLEACAARLSLVFHVVRAVWERRPETDPIDVQDVERATRLVDWLAREQARVYAMLQVDADGERTEQRVVGFIRRSGGRATVRDIAHGMREFRGRTDEAEKTLIGMVKAGWGRWVDIPSTDKGGRPTRVFELSKGVTVTTTRMIPERRQGSGDGDTTDTPVTHTPGVPDGADSDTREVLFGEAGNIIGTVEEHRADEPPGGGGKLDL